MSLSVSSEDDTIRQVIGDAENKGVIIFAAASNDGGNTGVAFPARMDKVLCIHASDGDGNKSERNPSPDDLRENFSTLGVAIESISDEGRYLSGTSYSTPVAAGFGANILRYVQSCYSKSCLTKEHRNKAFSRMGMRNIMLAMADKRDGYRYVTPWGKIWDEGTDFGDIPGKIKEALKGRG